MSRRKSHRRNKPLYQRVILMSLAIVLLITLITAILLVRAILAPNVITGSEDERSVYIHTGSDFQDVKEILYSEGLIHNQRSFEWLARKKGYPDLIKPGRYILENGMNNNDLINMLRLGLQTPVTVTFSNIRLKEDLASKVSHQIEADSVSIISLLNDSSYLEQFRVTPETALSLFIPNSYEFWWNTDAKGFIERMYQEYIAFWDASRTEKLERTGLSRTEALILASIVEKETRMNDEKPLIAGVYLNRFRRGWPLQADPTVVYAWGDFSMNRVLKYHTGIDSPYNTYKHKGLPPGPICVPSISSIDAVLNHKEHHYMYFCASPDLNGYHVFSRTLQEHNRNARAYHRALKDRQNKPS